ncbi:MAG: hypothetical protein NT025_09630 [bacterium]|nr:hypothetical protein [bacterium]
MFPVFTQRSRVSAAVLICSLAMLFAAGCAKRIALYDQTAYVHATSLKVESLALMDKAHDSYVQHEAEITALVTDIGKAHEYAKGIPKNEISTKLLEILMDPSRGLLGEFLDRWRQAPISSDTYLQEKKAQVAAAFDKIIGLESGKLKPQDISE